MAPRIVGGSNFDNPYAHPVSFDPFADKIFQAFEEPHRELAAQEIHEDPIAEIQSEFQEAQRRQREPRQRKGIESQWPES